MKAKENTARAVNSHQHGVRFNISPHNLLTIKNRNTKKKPWNIYEINNKDSRNSMWM